MCLYVTFFSKKYVNFRHHIVGVSLKLIIM